MFTTLQVFVPFCIGSNIFLYRYISAHYTVGGTTF